MPDSLIDLESLAPLFRPRSVAVIGASSNPEKIGGVPISYFLSHGYAGEIYPVNPKAQRIQELKAYANVKDIPAAVDLAVCAVPSSLACQALQDCADKGVKAVIMFSAGFAEIGEEGRRRQNELVNIAGSAGIRLLGPNCIGVANFGLHLAASFHPSLKSAMSRVGNIGIVSQSGAFSGLAVGIGEDRGSAFSYCVSTGNEADVDVADALGFLAADDETDVILVYMEGVRNGAKLLEALSMARAKGKPVVAIKLGRSDVGASAAASHTSALAGRDEIYDAVFRQYGVYRAQTIEEFFDVGQACAIGRLPRDSSVGLMTVSGGVGVLMADDANARGLDVRPTPEPLADKIKAMIPIAGVGNPIDVTGQVMNDISLYQQAVELVAGEGGYSSLVCWQGRFGDRGKPLIDTWHMIRDRHPDLILAVAGHFDQQITFALQDVGCLVARDPSRATRAVAALAGFRQHFDRPPPWPEKRGQWPALPAGPLNEVQVTNLLRDAGLPMMEERHVESAQAAVVAAQELGYPVVMKVVSPDILHKSDVGGVRLALAHETAVRQAYDSIVADVAANCPDAAIFGCLVAPMVEGGVETILGVHHDPVFGPVVMFGIGGVFVEVLKDVTFRVAPFDEPEAHRMIREIRGFPMLEGQRGQPPADIDALAHALAKLSVFADAHAGQLESLDINPFVVLPDGAFGLDAAIAGIA